MSDSHDPNEFLGLHFDKEEDSRLDMLDVFHCARHPKQHLEPLIELEDGRHWYYCPKGGNVIVAIDGVRGRSVIICPSLR